MFALSWIFETDSERGCSQLMGTSHITPLLPPGSHTGGTVVVVCNHRFLLSSSTCVQNQLCQQQQIYAGAYSFVEGNSASTGCPRGRTTIGISTMASVVSPKQQVIFSRYSRVKQPLVGVVGFIGFRSHVFISRSDSRQQVVLPAPTPCPFVERT